MVFKNAFLNFLNFRLMNFIKKSNFQKNINTLNVPTSYVMFIRV